MKLQVLLIPDYQNIARTMELANKYDVAFEYNDFYLPNVYTNEEEVQRRIALYKSQNRDRSKDTLHGVFLDITIHSMDPVISQYSKDRMKQSMEIAKDLGVHAVIFHTGLLADFKEEHYSAGWLDVNETYFRELLNEYESLNIYVENMFDQDSELLMKLADRMKDEKRFGICLDYAHAALTRNLPEIWMNECMVYIRHFHINDNDLIADQHRAMGDGLINWKPLKQGLVKMQTQRKHCEMPSLLLEVKGLDVFEKSYAFLNHLLED